MKIIYSSKNIASLNIANALDELGIPVIDSDADRITEVPCYGQDILVLSTHKSKIKEKIFTVHTTGNWNTAELGGKERTLSYADGSLVKKLLCQLEKNNLGWKVSLEADHHGPTCDHAVTFIEIGSTLEEWGDKDASQEVAKAIVNVLDDVEEYDCYFGVGGGHYPKTFNNIVLSSSKSIGHIAPKYVLDDLDYDMFVQAVEKNISEILGVKIIKKETNSSQKKKIIDFCSKYGVEHYFV